MTIELQSADTDDDRPASGAHVRIQPKTESASSSCISATTEIIKWLRVRGIIIPFNAGRSLSAIWQDIIAKFSAGEISKAEIAEALEHTVHRKNTRIPIAVQKMLLQLIRSSDE